MISSYFDNAAFQERLAHEAEHWRGTPFAPHAAIHGVGVDCVHLCAEIYKACGAIQKFDPPKYTMDGGLHLAQSLVRGWVEQSGRFQKVETPTVGDLLCFRIGRVEHHVGILAWPEMFVHAIRRYGVVTACLQDPAWGKRLTAIYRPMPL
jgi:cell wall-associated NlpC family hydrolase